MIQAPTPEPFTEPPERPISPEQDPRRSVAVPRASAPVSRRGSSSEPVLDRRLRGLAGPTRQVFDLRMTEGLSRREAAVTLDVSISEVRRLEDELFAALVVDDRSPARRSESTRPDIASSST